MKKLRKCPICKNYTLKKVCEKCNVESKIAHPPSFKFSKYLKYINTLNIYGNSDSSIQENKS